MDPLGFRVWSLGFGVWDGGFGIEDAGFEDVGLRASGLGLGFGV